MQTPSEEAKKYYEQALVYDEAGDIYNAIKLYKRIIKVSPDWVYPYSRLSNIYKKRQEWKPVFHFTKKALALDPTQARIWWDLGIVATALKKWRIAKSVWNKFGLPSQWPRSKDEVFSLYLSYQGQIELVWARPLCPARAMIISIPHPTSKRQFRDIVLYDREELKGHNIIGRSKMPIFNDLGIWKHSNFHTFSCRVFTHEPEDLEALEILCQNVGIGFENWNHTALTTAYGQKQKKSEFYNANAFLRTDAAFQRIAFAARHRVEVERILSDWQIIRLGEYEDLQQH